MLLLLKARPAARAGSGITPAASKASCRVAQGGMARVRISIVFESGARIGPGKVKLLESIRDTRLSSAAARVSIDASPQVQPG